MKLSFQTWLIIGLTIVIILLILFQPAPLPPDSTAWQEEIAHKEERIQKLTAQNKFDSIAHAQELDSLNNKLTVKATENKKLALNLARLKANPVVIKVRDSIPEVDEAFWDFDKALAGQDEQIEIQGDMITALKAENERITANFLERLQLQAETLEHQKELTQEYKKQNRKLRRVNRLLKVVAVIGTVGGLLLGSQ